MRPFFKKTSCARYRHWIAGFGESVFFMGLGFLLFLITGCSRQSPPPPAQKPDDCIGATRVIDKQYEFDTPAGFKMRVPLSTGPGGRGVNPGDDCKMTFLTLHFHWDENRLTPFREHAIPREEFFKSVTVYLGFSKGVIRHDRVVKPGEDWKLDGAIPLKNYPLIFYPKFEFRNPTFVNPHPERIYLGPVFGVIGTRQMFSEHLEFIGCDPPFPTRSDAEMQDYIIKFNTWCRGGLIFDERGGGTRFDIYGGVIKDAPAIFHAVKNALQSYVVKE